MSAAARKDPLTQKSQVLKVLQAGGRVIVGSRPGLLQLLDPDNNPVPAWQTALRAAQSATQASPTQTGVTP